MPGYGDDESRVDAVGHGMVPRFSESAVVKPAKENAESRADAVRYGMMPLLPDVSCREALVFTVRTPTVFIKVARSA